MADYTLSARVTGDASSFSRAMENAQNSLKGLSEKTKEIGTKVSDLGKSMSSTITPALTAIGAGAMMVASQFESSTARIQNSLGVTADEASDLAKVAKDIYKRGFGESFGDIETALIQVRQNMRNLSDDELESVIIKATALGTTFDAEINEVTRAATNLMTNFGMDSSNAFDLMATGAQNGLNFSNELFDNLAEYSPLWADMGYSAEEMFGILQAGAEQGVYNFDYLNDVMKEFQIRATDGSKATTEAVAALGPEVQKVWTAFSKGEATVSQMSQVAVAELLKIDDKVKQNELGVALFGTKWEDLGGDVVLSMLSAGEALTGFEGAMDSIVVTQEQTFGQQFQSMLRNLKDALLPIGLILNDLAGVVFPKISAATQFISDKFSGLSSNTQQVIVIVGLLVAVFGPLLIALGATITVLGTVAGSLSFLLGPIGLVIAAIVAIGIAVFAFRDDLMAAWQSSIQPTFMELVNFVTGTLVPVFQSGFNTAKTVVQTAFEMIENLWDSLLKPAFDTIVQVLQADLIPAFKTGFELASDVVKTAFELIRKAWTGILQPVFDIVVNILKYTLLPAFQVTFGVVGSLVSTTFTLIGTLWTGTLQPIFTGIIDFLSGVFTLNWEKAWSGVVSIFGGIFEGLKTVAKAPLNAVISMINAAIGGINSISVSIPDWVPEMGGKTLGFNLPKIPMLARGTDDWVGGFARMNEGGRGELVNLPDGTQVIPHDVSMKYAREAAKASYRNESDRVNRSHGDVHQEVNIYSNKPLSPSEIARKTKQAARELALEWG